MRFWNRAERWLIGVIGIAALALAAYQMISRYGFPDAAISWSEEVVVYLLIAAAFLSGSLLVEEDGHVRADLVLRQVRDGQQDFVGDDDACDERGSARSETLADGDVVLDFEVNRRHRAPGALRHG